MFPYIYNVVWADTDNIEDIKYPVAHGLVFAENFARAASIVSEYFGEEAIMKMTITPIGDGTENILDLTEEQAKSFETEFT